MIEETWDEREFPLLQAVYSARESGSDQNRAARDAVRALDDRQYMQTIEDLVNGGYLDAAIVRGDNRVLNCWVRGITPEGLRVVGAWPSGTAADAFLRALSLRAEEEPDPERKKLLVKLLETATDVGKGVLTGVLIHVATRGL